MKKDTDPVVKGGRDPLKTKSAELLPKTADEIINGGLYHQAVRCGKTTCRCAAGPPHEGYYYFIRRVNGRLRKTYVPKRQVRRLRLLVQQSKHNRQIERETRFSSRALLAELRSRLREYQHTIKTLANARKYDG